MNNTCWVREWENSRAGRKQVVGISAVSLVSKQVNGTYWVELYEVALLSKNLIFTDILVCYFVTSCRTSKEKTMTSCSFCSPVLMLFGQNYKESRWQLNCQCLAHGNTQTDSSWRGHWLQTPTPLESLHSDASPHLGLSWRPARTAECLLWADSYTFN